MKKILSLIALLLMVCSMANAQYMLKIQLKDGTHDLFWVDCTDDVRWQKDYSDPNQVYMEVSGRLVGQQNRWSMNYPLDQIEEMSIVGTEPKAPAEEQSTFLVDEQTSSVNMVNYSIEFGPSAIEEQKALTVNRIDNITPPEDLDGIGYMIAYDFDLEGIHDLNGVVEIRIPVSKSCYAVYLNEETGEWDPVLSYFDSSTNEMVIITDHLSTYGVFDVTDEHTRKAKLKYNGFDPQAPVDMDKVVEKLSKIVDSDDPTFAAIDAFANDEFTMYSLGLSVGMTPIKVGGFDLKILNKYSDIIGNMGTAWSIVQFCNTLRKDDNVAKASGAAKLAFDLALKPALEKKIYAGNLLFPACMTAIAVLDWELNWFATTVHNTATTLYSNAYQQYFRRDKTYPRISGYGYRTACEWYDLIYPIIVDRNNLPSELTEKIDMIVVDYVNQPWKDADGFNEALTDCRGSWPFWVEISNKDRKAISDNHRSELYNETLKSVLTNINRKMLCKTVEKFDAAYKDYAKMMNKVVNLKFKDSSVKDGEKSKFAGCKIKFSELPSSILDPDKWECTIKDDGTATIQFRMFPYCNEGVKPELTVVDKEDAFIGNIDIDGIQDIGKYYEVNFDLANNEVLDLEDKWDSSIDPVMATVATTDVSGNIYTWGPLVYSSDKGLENITRGKVPGDIYGIYNGIMELFENRTLSFDAEGNFTYENKGLTMSGNFNSRTGFGTGKFTLTAMSTGSDFVNEADAFDDWFQNVLKYNGFSTDPNYKQKAWTSLKNFSADFSVAGTLQINYSALMKRYALHLEGIGSFNFDGYYYSSSDDIYPDFDEDGKYVWKYHSKTMNTLEIYVNDGQFIFSPTLIFE